MVLMLYNLLSFLGTVVSRIQRLRSMFSKSRQGSIKDRKKDDDYESDQEDLYVERIRIQNLEFRFYP